MEAIPEDVLLRYAIRQSSEALPSGLMCPEANCLTAANQRRRANKECERVPPRCAQCCKGMGGCSVKSHKLSVRDVPPEIVMASAGPSMANAPPAGLPIAAQHTSAHPIPDNDSIAAPPASREPTSAIQRTYARPLKDEYAKAYVIQHQKREEASQKLEKAQALAMQMSNLVQVIFWGKVSFFSPLQLTRADFTFLVSLAKK